MLKNTTFRKLNLFPPSGEWRETATLLGPKIEVTNRNDYCSLRNCAVDRARYTGLLEKLLTSTANCQGL
jgi:hypothetical protein